MIKGIVIIGNIGIIGVIGIIGIIVVIVVIVVIMIVIIIIATLPPPPPPKKKKYIYTISIWVLIMKGMVLAPCWKREVINAERPVVTFFSFDKRVH